MKKFFIVALAVVCMIIIVDQSFGLVVSRISPIYTHTACIKLVHNKYDVAIIGASQVNTQYVTRMIADSLGIKMYSYTQNQHNIWKHYIWLNLMVHESKYLPRLIIKEVERDDVHRSTDPANIRAYQYYGLLNYDDSVAPVVHDFDVDKASWIMANISNLYRYNRVLMPVIYNYYNGIVFDEENLGFQGTSMHEYNAPLDTNRWDAAAVIDSKKIDYNRRFIRLCKQNKIKLLYVNAPLYMEAPNQIWLDTLSNILKEENVPFLDFDRDPAFHKLFIKHPEWYYNPNHLNPKGAEQYTRRIIPYLKETIDSMKIFE